MAESRRPTVGIPKLSLLDSWKNSVFQKLDFLQLTPHDKVGPVGQKAKAQRWFIAPLQESCKK
jgi:hypothetical protein